ncbi:MAG TPA: phage tail tip lysozyme [Solirubrobacteraceae bacterium]|nr:phage tail tip lysozyme [Solirubrobacteraceae bacterium]
MKKTTGEPYTYAGDNPIVADDPEGDMTNGDSHFRNNLHHREEYVFSYLEIKGRLTPNGSAGVIGNLLVETSDSLNPAEGEIGDSNCLSQECGIGIAQWTTFYRNTSC